MYFPLLGGVYVPVNTTSVTVNSIKNSYPGGSGAVGDGVNDDTAAIRYWLNQGGLLWAPPGTYRVTGNLPYALSGTNFFGSGVANTIIQADDTAGNFGDIFTLTSLRTCSLQSMTIDAKSGRSAGAAVKVAGGVSSYQLGSFGICNGGHTIDIDLNNQFDGVVFVDAAGLGDWGTTIGNASRKAMWRNFSAGGHGGVWFNSPHAASEVVENIFMSAPLATGAAVGIRYTASGDITLRSVQTLGMGGGFVADCTSNPSAAGDGLVMMNGCQWDSTATNATYHNVLVNLGGGLSGVIYISMDDTWVAGATGNGIYVTGGSPTVCKLNWSSGVCFSNTGFGVKVDNGAGNTRICVTQSAANVGGVFIDSNTGGTTSFT